MKLKLKYFDPSDVTTFVNKGAGKHVISDGFTTIPIYKGKLYSIKDVVNKDGTVNVRKAKKIMEEVAEYFGGKKMLDRLENPVWHKDDPNTWLHTKKVALNAWQIPVPEGYTKQDLMVAALGHDFGKILSGDGHAEVSYNLLKLIFPDATEKQLNAVRKHMDDLGTHIDILETATKFADLGVTPTAALETLSLTPEELEIVKLTKWFKKGGTIQNEVVLYHNCPKSALNSILKNGIKASYSINKNNLTHKEIADKVKKIPKVVYLGSKRMADGIGAYRKKHGYADDEGITLELKIPKKDFDNFKLIQNPECLGASDVNEYIKIRKNNDSNISEKEIKLRWKVINPPYTITVANDIDPKYIVNKFKEGGTMKLIPKAAGGKKLLEDIFYKIFPGKSLKDLTPEEWDLAYDYVLKKYGNKESNVLLKIRDYHFYTAAPETVVREASGKPIQVFHGGTSPSIRKFRLDTPNNASLTNTLDKRIYFSNSKGVAKLYAVDPEYKLALTIDHLADAVGLDREGIEIIASRLKMPVKDVKKIIKDYEIGLNFVMRKTNEEDFIYPAYLNIRKHADVDLDGEIISRLSKELRAKINAEPAAIIRNVDETVDNLYGMRIRPATDYLVQYPQQIKRSAAITYDTNGNIIPISLRDNFYNPDINFKEGGNINYFSGAAIAVSTTIAANSSEIPAAKNGMKLQEGGVIESSLGQLYESGTGAYSHLPSDKQASLLDLDLMELFKKGYIKNGQLNEKAKYKLLKKYNLTLAKLLKTLNEIIGRGFGSCLILDLPEIREHIEEFKLGGIILKCSIGAAIRKFAGEGLESLGERAVKKLGEDVLLQTTGTVKVINKATTDHLNKVAKSTGDKRIKVLADFATLCREKDIKLPEEFNLFVDSIFKTPTVIKSDKKIIRTGQEIIAEPELITWKGKTIERPTFEKTKYKTKTIHTGEFKDKLEFRRTVPKTQEELQQLSPKIDEAINSLRNMMEGDNFKLTPMMMDEIYSKSKGKVLSFSDNKKLTRTLRKLFAEIEYPTLVKRQLEETYINPTSPSRDLDRFYEASTNNIDWFRLVRNFILNYKDTSLNLIQVTPLVIRPKNKEKAVYRINDDYVSFLPKQIMSKRVAPYVKTYQLTLNGKPIKGVPNFNFDEHHQTPLALMLAEAYLANPTPKNTMEHVLTYLNLRKINGSKNAHYDQFLVLDKTEHTGVNGIHYKDKWSLLDLQRIKALSRSGRFKTMDDLIYYYDRLKAQQLSYLPKAKSGTKLIPKNSFGGTTKKLNYLDLLNMFKKLTKISYEDADGVKKFRQAIDADDRFVAGVELDKVLDLLPVEGYWGHGMRKFGDAEALANVRMILTHGTDPSKPFYSAGLKMSKENKLAASALGTASGKPYMDGPFILINKAGSDTTNPKNFTHVLINDSFDNLFGKELAEKYKKILLQEFPDVKIILYSEVKNNF